MPFVRKFPRFHARARSTPRPQRSLSCHVGAVWRERPGSGLNMAGGAHVPTLFVGMYAPSVVRAPLNHATLSMAKSEVSFQK